MYEIYLAIMIIGIYQSQITDNLIVFQELVQANNKENTKVLHYWPFVLRIRLPVISPPRADCTESVSISCHKI